MMTWTYYDEKSLKIFHFFPSSSHNVMVDLVSPHFSNKDLVWASKRVTLLLSIYNLTMEMVALVIEEDNSSTVHASHN